MSFIKNNFQNKFALFRRLTWFWLGVSMLIIRYMTPPQYIETYYSRFIFQGVRQIFDYTLAMFPMPLLLIFYGIMVYFVVKMLIFLVSKKQPLRQRFTEGGLKTLNFLGFILLSFFFLWCFNYGRPSFSEQIGLTIQKLDTVAVRQELSIAAHEAIAARDTLLEQMLLDNPMTNDTSTVFSIPIDFETKMRKDVSLFLEKQQFPAGGNLRGRQIKPDGLLFRFGIAGIYMPFIGESSIDNALYPLEKPFSMAHELAHGYGWTEEATANFVAYLSCIQSDDLLTRYSGYLSYYRYVASNFKREFPEEYAVFRKNLPKGIQYDLMAINNRINQYPDWFDTSAINDIYLKSQGVTAGVGSYSRIVVMVYSWRKIGIGY